MYRITGHGTIKAPNIWIWSEHWVQEWKWWELKLKIWQKQTMGLLEPCFELLTIDVREP